MPSKTKRGNGRGSVYFEKKNSKFRWQVSIKGERMGGYCATKTEAERALALAVADRERGELQRPDRVLLSEAIQEWLASKKRDLKPKTYASYEYTIKKHILPALGTRKLQSLTVRDLARFQEEMERHYSTSTIKHARTILRNTFDRAVAHEVITRNPIDKVTLKGRPSERREVWTPEQAAAFVTVAREDYVMSALIFSLMTGMRRGEVCGLLWKDIDLEQGSLRITRSLVTVNGRSEESTPKTQSSRRGLNLSPDTVAFLRQHRQRQVELAQVKVIGTTWQDTGYIFTSLKGTPWHPDSLRTKLREAAAEAGIPAITIHGLRHTHTSLMARKGVPIEVISKRLGHTRISTTMDIYRHTYEDELKGGALDIMDLTA